MVKARIIQQNQALVVNSYNSSHKKQKIMMKIEDVLDKFIHVHQLLENLISVENFHNID